jgi:hypothetical protein
MARARAARFDVAALSSGGGTIGFGAGGGEMKLDQVRVGENPVFAQVTKFCGASHQRMRHRIVEFYGASHQ